MVKAFDGDSPLRQGAGKSFWILPISRQMMAAACSIFRGKLIKGFRFSHRGEYIGGRAASGSGPGAHTCPWCGLGVARAMGWRGRLLAPLHLIFGLRHASGKIGTLAFVPSNSKNISCVAFLKHINNRKIENWHCGISLVD
jgi:hypothetical protein